MTDWNDPVDTMTVAVRADTTQFQQQIADASRLGRQFGNSLVTAFDGIAIKGKSVSDVMRSLALNLSQLVLKSALKPLTNSLGGALSGLLGGGIGFAKGGVLQQRMPVPFASGGVISSPVTFPLAGGRTGLAGERGAEAIMPLARGPDGRLGCCASWGWRRERHVQRFDARRGKLQALGSAGGGDGGARRRARSTQPLRRR